MLGAHLPTAPLLATLCQFISCSQIAGSRNCFSDCFKIEENVMLRGNLKTHADCAAATAFLSYRTSQPPARRLLPGAYFHLLLASPRLLPFFTMTKFRTLKLASTMQPRTDLRFLSPVLLGR